MTARLIYHTPESMAGGVSPFDIAISEMTENEDLRIACPYIGLPYFERMIEKCSSWRLITDVQEWLRSNGGDSRDQIVELILANAERVRHCEDLHAKVLIGERQALTGSANFTMKGITGRVEVSVLFEAGEQVDELRAWFDLLWSETKPVLPADLRAYAVTTPQPDWSRPIAPLPCDFPGVAATLLHTAVALGGSPDAESRLIECLRQAPDRRWADSFLDMANDLLNVTHLQNDDPRLDMAIRREKFLAITIGCRMVLAAFRVDKVQDWEGWKWLVPNYVKPPNHAAVELILPTSMAPHIEGMQDAIRHGSYDPRFSGETRENVPRFVSFSKPSVFGFSPDVIEAWKQASRAECDNQRISNFRKFHQPIFHRAVTDLAYRHRLLDRAFEEITA